MSGPVPSFRSDDGSVDPDVSAALEAFATGRGSEHDALSALAVSRLLVPIVPVRSDEMALPTLIGRDGRRAMPAFTCLSSLRGWQEGARPVPVAARQVWLAATEDSCAVVIDVAGPVSLAIEGARLAALARGDVAPLPWDDPDVRQIVAAVLVGHLQAASFALGPADTERDLAIKVTMVGQGASRDARELAEVVAADVMARLGDRLRRGVEIWLG